MLYENLRHIARRHGPNAVANYLKKRDFPLEQQAYLVVHATPKRTSMVQLGRGER